MDRGDAASVNARLSIALAIAGSDSGGGAGIQADLKTFAALGVHGASVVTALTAQNTRNVRAIHYPPPGIVGAQIGAVLEDFEVAAIKIGMLGIAAIVEVVAERLPSRFRLPEEAAARSPATRPFLVYDPVMIASSGDSLSGGDFVEAIAHKLLPLVDCLTPNLAEAAALLGEPLARSEADMARQGAALLKLGPRAVLMKGGHLEGKEAVDLLVTSQNIRRYSVRRVASRNLHGTGCTLSSAIAANVALGMALPGAVASAKAFVCEAIERGRRITLGAGPGPLIQTKLG
ncbi:MAG: bifunctional hydroxymethylpyrimidine kinase/phosphomethylpyrimidine kinase [Roseiarcus sp.]